MCGIVGYYGEKKSQKILINGLNRLEYRGYDSSGIAFLKDNFINVKKSKGRLNELKNKLNKKDDGNIGIGHTRWATHGKPSDENSHPHLSYKENFCVVHNGIIENYIDIKKKLLKKGCLFSSETDTEVISNLLEITDNKKGFLNTVLNTIKKLKGAYALCIISKKYPKEIIAVRKSSPIVVGIKNNEYFIASDIPAILEHTKDIYILEENEIAYINNNGLLCFYDNLGKKIIKKINKINWNLESSEKQGYKHFMLKEIYEQPDAIKNTLFGKIKKEKIIFNLNFDNNFIKSIDKISIISCGTSSYAGRIGAYFIEKYLRIPVEVDFASEFRYKDPIINNKTLAIVISQSGETADTLSGLREAKTKGAKIFAITNVVGSSISRESDEIMYTQAGPEIAVASTKAYVTQLVVIYLLILKLGKIRRVLDNNFEKKWINGLIKLSNQVKKILKNEKKIKEYSKKLQFFKNAFFIGRGIDCVSSLEGALKLKEISYIHAEAYAAGELKHGTLALITEKTPVIAISTQKLLFEKTLNNIIEVKARGALTYGIGFEKNIKLKKTVNYFFGLPEAQEDFAPILTVIPLQLLAYYTSVFKGNDVDKPRNLAKSVTVE